MEKIVNKKALFVQRFGAFVIDIFIVYLVTSLISVPFVDQKKVDNIQDKSSELVLKYSNEEIGTDDFISEYASLYYKNATSTGFLSLIYIVCAVLYFIVYQTYRNGQTIGKRVMKIRVVSDSSELSMNQMIFRSLLANCLLINLLSFVLMLFSSKYIYFYCVAIIELIFYIMTFISIIMVMYRRDGRSIHDMLVHTHVESEK